LRNEGIEEDFKMRHKRTYRIEDKTEVSLTFTLRVSVEWADTFEVR